MTATERDRLIIVEQNQKDMADDISELKDDVKEILARLDGFGGAQKALMWLTGTIIGVASILAFIWNSLRHS